jgi:hypothetical protein
MAQAQGPAGGMKSLKLKMPKWLNAKRILIMAIIATIIPGLGWIIDTILILRWWGAAKNKQ